MKCPNCQSTRIRKHGFYRNKQRYQCKDCARQFVENHQPNLTQQTSTGVEDKIDRYITSISTPSNDLLLNLQRATIDYSLSQMQPTLAQAEAIALLMRSMGASRVLELGIFSSYSTLSMALALPPQGQLISSGVAGKHLNISRDYWQQSGVATQIDFQVGSGLELLDRLLATTPVAYFDLITIAGLKHQYPLYYHRAIELLRPQGLLVTTDVLWQGRVLNPDIYDDPFTTAIDLFNRELAADPRVKVSVFPLGDGISIAIKL
ncbi:SAM-dependent methyltransferase [Chamaesiphon sp. VAR_48_metabat_135_sub]|uniref:IS1/IS1595 family N-terminal zinc-binding domain-containing protein n=1 Tax=Chamaesiphon sp. VAR_48_metabat_135_sub TaxID=2964699 RepID=UPI0037BEE92B